MADQDFNIKIVTSADTSGIRQTAAEMEALRRQASIAAVPSADILAARKASLAAALTPIPEGLLIGGKTLEEEMQGATLKEEEAAGAALLMGANLGKARQEALVLTRELATGGNVARTLGSLLGALGPQLTVAGIAGLVVYEQIQKMREESEKLVAETAALGAEFEKSAIAAQGLVQGARTPADITKVAQSVLPELDKIHAELDKVNNQSISGVQKVLEDLREGIIQMSPYVSEEMRQWAHPYTLALREAQRQAQDNADFADHEAVRRIERAKDFERQFEELKTEPLEEAQKHLLDIMEEQTTLQKNLNKDGEDYVKSWLAAQAIIDRAKEDLAAITKYHEQIAKAAKAEAAPLVKELVTPTDKFVAEQRRAAYEHEAERAALVQKGREAIATGDTEKAKAIQEELTQDKFSRDQKKEALQRYVANQESIGAVAGDDAATRKAVGSAGLAKYNQAQGELARIYEEERAEREKGIGREKRIEAEEREPHQAPTAQLRPATAEGVIAAVKDNTTWLTKLYQLWA